MSTLFKPRRALQPDEPLELTISREGNRWDVEIDDLHVL
jgi:hypothetical protein